jgi:hypothetical protein
MRLHLDRESLAKWFEDHLAAHGEWVWDTFTQIGHARYTLPHMWTTWVVNVYRDGAINVEDPGGWIGEYVDGGSVRLFLREGESYLADRSRHFRPPITIKVKSEAEFIAIEQLPTERWWEAPFVCPFCKSLDTPQSHCEHLLVFDGWVVDQYQSPLLQEQLSSMSRRHCNINFANLDLPGLRIKIQRDFYGHLEWFRSACWYIRSPAILPEIEAVLTTPGYTDSLRHRL